MIFPSIHLPGFLTADGSWETSHPFEGNYESELGFFFLFFFSLFIHLASSGKPKCIHATNKPVTLLFIQINFM